MQHEFSTMLLASFWVCPLTFSHIFQLLSRPEEIILVGMDVWIAQILPGFLQEQLNLYGIHHFAEGLSCHGAKHVIYCGSEIHANQAQLWVLPKNTC